LCNGIAWNKDDSTILVSDNYNNLIYIYDVNGTFIRWIRLTDFSGWNAGAIQLYDEQIYAVDFPNNNRIISLDINGTIIFVLSSQQLPPNVQPFTLVQDLHVTKDHLYIADVGVFNVFLKNGSFVEQVVNTHAPAGFHTTEGITVDSQGRIYVSNYFPPNVEVFNAEGELLYTIGDFGSPAGLALHKDMLYVVDNTRHLVSVFKIPSLSSSSQIKKPFNSAYIIIAAVSATLFFIVAVAGTITYMRKYRTRDQETISLLAN